MLGGVPDEWLIDAMKDGVLKERPNGGSPADFTVKVQFQTNKISESAAEGFQSLEENIKFDYINDFDPSTLQLGEEDFRVFRRYLRRMLVVEPGRRATTEELLQDPWVADRNNSSSSASE